MSRRISSSTTVAIILMCLLFSSIVIASPASADCTDPNTGCSETREITDILSAIVDVVLVTLKYVGFITLTTGGIMWFTASVNSDRAQNGVWLLTTGVLTIGFYIGYEAFLGLLNYISTN
jgi:hypothetical protein